MPPKLGVLRCGQHLFLHAFGVKHTLWKVHGGNSTMISRHIKLVRVPTVLRCLRGFWSTWSVGSLKTSRT